MKPAGGNLQRTELRRTGGLARTSGLTRTASLPRTPWKPAVPYLAAQGKSAARTRSSRTTSRRTANSGPTPKVRALVLERDGYRCACGCRQSILGQRYSLGHRLRASQGGKAVPSNLLTFLGWGGEECHGRIDSRRDPCDEANGMTVRSFMDPKQVRVTIVREDGSKARKYAWDDGTWRDKPEPAEVAA
jgi:hypothetical protein